VPHKLSARSTPCVILGYPANHRGYRCLDLQTRQVITSRHVIFDRHGSRFSLKLSRQQLNQQQYLMKPSFSSNAFCSRSSPLHLSLLLIIHLHQDPFVVPIHLLRCILQPLHRLNPNQLTHHHQCLLFIRCRLALALELSNRILGTP
jgi:hypothetical protein